MAVDWVVKSFKVERGDLLRYAHLSTSDFNRSGFSAIVRLGLELLLEVSRASFYGETRRVVDQARILNVIETWKKATAAPVENKKDTGPKKPRAAKQRTRARSASSAPTRPAPSSAGNTRKRRPAKGAK
jgi:hypothetical protein